MAGPGSPFPDWDKPATKGDVIMAMIWTQSLSIQIANVAIAAQKGDLANFQKAVDLYLAEHDVFASKIAEIAGNR